MMLSIESIQLTREQTRLCMGELRRTNRLRKKWSKLLFGQRKDRKLRLMLLKAEGRKEVSKAIDQLENSVLAAEWEADLKEIEAIYKTPVVELEGRTVYDAVFKGYIRMAFNRAIKWASHSENGGILDRDDIEQESMAALIHAIYGYAAKEKFSTYLWTCLKNHFVKATDENSSRFCNIKEPHRKLLARYDAAKRNLNRAANFEEVVEVLGLTEDERDIINSLFTKMYCESQVAQVAGTDFDDGVDITCLRNTEHEQPKDMVDDHDEETIEVGLRQPWTQEFADRVERSLSLETRELLDSANLTLFERNCFLTNLAPFPGWRTSISAAHINPTTGKPYSRMFATLALREASTKFERVYKEAA